MPLRPVIPSNALHPPVLPGCWPRSYRCLFIKYRHLLPW